jgi:N-dimethylarginine dimethylaminohydrolase
MTCETGRLRQVLLCPPDHYHWISTNAVAEHTLASNLVLDTNVAHAQFQTLVETLTNCGVTCRFLQPEPGLPYQVYTRDSSQTTPWGPLLTMLRMPERRGEVGAVLAHYAASATPLWRTATAGTIEGGDIHLIREGLAVIGYSGVRTSRPGAEQFAGWLRAQGWEVRLQPFAAHFLHLDVLFCMASDNLAVASTEILGDDFAAWLTSHGIATIEAGYREVMAMSCNILALGDNRVISPVHSTRINARLRDAGLQVLTPDLSCFAHGGGSVHCMTMPLQRDPA